MFPNRLRTALEAHGMTQEALARHLNVSLSTVTKWCTGRNQPHGARLIELAKALDREPGWFYEADEPRAAA